MSNDGPQDPGDLLNLEGCADLLTRIAALGGPAPSGPAAQMWLSILGEIRYGDALVALVEHYRESPHHCTPHDIHRRAEEWWEWWRVSGYETRLGSYDGHAPVGGEWPASQLVTATELRQRRERAALEDGR